MTIKRIIYLLSMTFLFASCERLGSYDYLIDNKSDSTLVVSYKWLTDIQSKTIPAHSVVIVDTFETINGLSDWKSHFLKRYFDTISVTINNSPIKKDIYNNLNWTYTVDEDRYKNLYRLTIENKDLH